jgi:membrane protein DedA with SNARE-associated domain
MSGSGVLGVPALVAVLLVSDAGAPIPFPTDVLLFVLGERAAVGVLPLWLAIAVVELVAVAGTAALFAVSRGAGHRLVTRFGSAIGLTADRVHRAQRAVERRGRAGLAVGRATPGLRTITVLAAGGAGVRARRALPALVVGSTVFLQLHLAIGYVAGPAARDVVSRLTKPALFAVLALAAAGAVAWLIARRRRHDGAAIWHEGVCPACLALAAVGVRSTVEDDWTAPAPGADAS